jgi:hypothetical protein
MPNESGELLMVAPQVGEAAARFGGIAGHQAAFYAAEALGSQRGNAACSAFLAAYLKALHPIRTCPSRGRPFPPKSQSSETKQ